ncbi:MAG: acetoin utilization protein AcuC [Betaproteobacteria bacterium]|nr:acetoin utilization protein AcuC [Betaproteobacteria bacterium]
MRQHDSGAMAEDVILFVGDALAKYGFPAGHPLGVDRQAAFWSAAQQLNLHRRAAVRAPRAATRGELERFHTAQHIGWVESRSEAGEGYLDYGDTPAFPGVFDAGAAVAGTALEGLERIMAGEAAKTFQPIGGLHHARRGQSAGFCVFNDLGVVIDTLRVRFGLDRIAYVDIDVHHGDGIFYSYENDPSLTVVDIHESGHFLYPGTGHADETGRGAAEGTKLNLPLDPGAGDRDFFAAWERGLEHLRARAPQFVILQCGADSLLGDPLADLRLTPAAHGRVARDLVRLANDTAGGRMMVFGGGGYNLGNLAAAWTRVLADLVSVD